ncbi:MULTISPECIES: hypothetical protein [unclassified Streptomyces]|uniref:hypothetical protein n=1 Tax=unclassified Streptomyces TaxID=2593676 RepID=UPI001660FA1C|nr:MULTISPECIES: hypothetical protein [unclassified Streptomyces]MBD0709276.1 hypothetical protein [Streptomyces sp. CBMA291]MBD0714153.1 hypothetical protein [Streptomyces sp. CBMA370]
MSDTSAGDVRRRAPALLVLLALFALLVSVCHGSHGHLLPTSGARATLSAPAQPHGCEPSGDAWSFDAHLPAQSSAAPVTAPGAGGAVLLPYAADLRVDPRARCVRGRAGPGPAPGRLLTALGVNRN